MTADVYASLVAPLIALALADGRLVVGVADPLVLPLIARRLGGRVARPAARALGNIAVDFVAPGYSP